ncbi:zinc finger protein [Trichonephila clavipes]|nr:zinc finger protein [Trichonephila clavipes]
MYNIYTFVEIILVTRLTFAEGSFLTLADGAKYSISCREQITHFLNFYTLVDGAHEILACLIEKKSPSPDIHTALTGGAHRFQLLSSRGKSRLLLAWHSRIRSASDQSALSHRVLEGVSSSLQCDDNYIFNSKCCNILFHPISSELALLP